jgi:hypothetical protein
MKANQSPRLVFVAIENLSARAPTSTLELIGGDGQSHWQVRIPERKVHDIAIAGDRFALSEEVHDFADAEQRDHLTVRDFNGGLKWEYPCCPRSCGWLEAGLLWTWQPNNFCLWDIEALDKPIRRIKIQLQGSTSSRLFVLPNQHLALPQDAPVGEAGLRWKDLGRYDKDLGADCNVARETSRHTDVCLQFVRGQLLLFPPSQKPSFINIANGVATGVLPMEPNARVDRDGTQFLYSDQPHPRAIALTPDGKGLWEFYCPTQCQVVKSCLGIVQLGFGKCRPGFTRPEKGGK